MTSRLTKNWAKRNITTSRMIIVFLHELGSCESITKTNSHRKSLKSYNFNLDGESYLPTFVFNFLVVWSVFNLWQIFYKELYGLGKTNKTLRILLWNLYIGLGTIKSISGGERDILCQFFWKSSESFEMISVLFWNLFLEAYILLHWGMGNSSCLKFLYQVIPFEVQES